MRKVFRDKVKTEDIEKKKTLTPSRDRQKFIDPLAGPRGHRLRFPTNVIAGALATASVEQMSPPGCRVYHDTWNGRWLISMGTIVKSRSWLKYGHTQSAMVLLGKMWERYQELYGLENVQWEVSQSLDATARSTTQPIPEPAPDE